MADGSADRLAWQIDRYLEYRAVRLSANSLAAYGGDLRLLLRALAVVSAPGRDEADVEQIDAAAKGLGIDVLTIDRLAAAFARLRAGAFRGKATGPRSDASVRRIWATANNFCARLVDRRILSGNPMAGVDNAAAPQFRPKALTTGEADALIATAGASSPPGVRIRWPARDRALILTGLLAGLRASELLSLTVSSLRTGEGGLFLHVRGKGGKDRSVPVAVRLQKALESYLNERRHAGAPDGADPMASRLTTASADTAGSGAGEFPWGRLRPADAPVFITTRGDAMSRYQLTRITAHIYTQAGLATGDGVAVHALRHTFATRLHERGASTFEMQRLLGHASPATTQRYVRTSPADLRPLIDALAPGESTEKQRAVYGS